MREFGFACGLLAVLAFSAAGSDDVQLETVTSEEWMGAANSNGKLLAVFYQEDGCPSCQEMVDLITSLLGDPELDSDLRLAKSSDGNLAAAIGITSFPALVFLREKSHIIFDGQPLVEDVLEWLEISRSKVTQDLYDDSFEHKTQASTGATTGDWLVVFYQEKCAHVLPVLESVGIRIRQKTNVAAVESSQNKLLANRFAIRECPEIILFKQGKMYRYEVPMIDAMSLKSFVDVWYKNSKAEIVLPPKSKFDFLTESIADYLKSQLEGEKGPYIVGGLCAGLAFTLALLCCCCCCCRSGGDKQKRD